MLPKLTKNSWHSSGSANWTVSATHIARCCSKGSTCTESFNHGVSNSHRFYVTEEGTWGTEEWGKLPPARLPVLRCHLCWHPSPPPDALSACLTRRALSLIKLESPFPPCLTRIYPLGKLSLLLPCRLTGTHPLAHPYPVPARVYRPAPPFNSGLRLRKASPTSLQL